MNRSNQFIVHCHTDNIMVRPILFYAEFSPAARAVLQTLKVLKVDVELR